MSVPSSIIGSPAPFPCKCVPPPPSRILWGTRLRGRRWWEPIQTTHQKLWHSVYSVGFLFCATVWNGIPSFFIFSRIARNGIAIFFRSAKQAEFWLNESKFPSVPCCTGKNFSQKMATLNGWDLAKWLELLTANARVAAVLGSIPASSDTVKSEGWQMK